jgi:hypothetical protein
MKTNQLALGLALAAFGGAAHAQTTYYATAEIAQASCGTDQVVWIDLDRGRYYKAGTVDFGKSSNGAFSCERLAHAKYREGKSEATSVATK